MSYEIYRRFNIDIEVVDQFCFGGFEIFVDFGSLLVFAGLVVCWH
jgi:hypothetical protein